MTDPKEPALTDDMPKWKRLHDYATVYASGDFRKATRMRDEIVSDWIDALAADREARATGAVPAWTTEHHIALREAHVIAAGDAFWKARPNGDTPATRIAFDAGFTRGFDCAEKLVRERAAAPDAPTEPAPKAAASPEAVDDTEQLLREYAALAPLAIQAGYRDVECEEAEMAIFLPKFARLVRADALAAEPVEARAAGREAVAIIGKGRGGGVGVEYLPELYLLKAGTKLYAGAEPREPAQGEEQ